MITQVQALLCAFSCTRRQAPREIISQILTSEWPPAAALGRRERIASQQEQEVSDVGVYTGFRIKDFLTSELGFKFPEAIVSNYWQIKKECVVHRLLSSL